MSNKIYSIQDAIRAEPSLARLVRLRKQQSELTSLVHSCIAPQLAQQITLVNLTDEVLLLQVKNSAVANKLLQMQENIINNLLLHNIKLSKVKVKVSV